MANSSYLTNNFKANMVLALPTVYIISTLFSGFSTTHYLTFFVIYTLSSRFYNPDLDHRTNRPGMLHFPFGKTAMEWMMKISNQGGMGRVLEPIIQIQKIITKIWFVLWFPLAILITHRGILHWPVVGVLIRNYYLYLIVYIIDSILLASGIHLLTSFRLISWEICQQFVNPSNNPTFLFCILPVYVADVNHSAVDALDSIRNRRRFCPAGENAIPKGLIYNYLKIKI